MATDLNAITRRHVVRFTLEAVTPLSAGTGQGAGLFDTALVRDANGLPTIPGPALAGVLQSLHHAYFPGDKKNRRDLFGYEDQDADKSHGEKGQASRLEISFGCIHDQKNRAIEGLLVDKERRKKLDDDPILRLARRDAPIKRDHVAIGHRGAAFGKQKFDRASLPPGYRFSFEIGMWGRGGKEYEADKEKLLRVLSLLKADDFRLGGATRRGLGKLKLVTDDHVFYACFDLGSKEGRKAFIEYHEKLRIDEAPEKFGDQESKSGFEKLKVSHPVPEKEKRKTISLKLTLKPIDFWRFGEGDRQITQKRGDKDKEADSLPLTEAHIVYNNGKGEIQEDEKRRLAIPASAIKGPLAHRAEFYLNCKQKNFADADKFKDEDTFKKATKARGMDELLGSAKKRKDGKAGESSGMAGLVLIDDAYIELGVNAPKTCLITHNTIDRFTGGVMHQRLFTEEVLYKGELTIELEMLTGKPDGTAVENKYWEALSSALDDLCEGRLALGADGHGYCEGSLDKPDWLKKVKAATGGTSDRPAS